MLLPPPKGVPPKRLLRTLLRTPRPVEALTYRFPFAPDVALQCRAIHPLEWSEVLEYGGAARRLTLLSHVLCDASGALVQRRFLDKLHPSEIGSCFAATIGTLLSISPMMGMVDRQEWDAKLRDGARALGHYAMTLGAMDGNPEAFFGLQRHEMLDGHWMAYYAASAVYEEARKANGRR